MSILNVINSVLAYSDPGCTDNPQMRAFDFTRKFSGIRIDNPMSDYRILAPGTSLQLFDGTVASGLDGTSVISIQLLPSQTSVYRVSVTGDVNFRTARGVSALGSTTVTINNNAVAVFNFGSASLTGVTVGDVLRISGQQLNDTGPFAFNPINSGFWTIIGISGTSLSCVRFVGQEFQGVNETVTATSTDVQIYSAAGIQVGNKVTISGTLSIASQRTYVIQAVTPSTFDITSAIPLPNESGLAYVLNSFVFYSSSKRLLYIEVDQNAAVQCNADTSNNNVVSPIVPGKEDLVGYFSKFGDTYAATVVNQSINSLHLKWFSAE